MSSILKISEAVALGIHACVIIAGNKSESNTTTTFIASALKASEAHLSKVMQRLVKAGVVFSARGPGGGFMLKAKPEEIKLIDIYEAVDGSLNCSNCLFDHQPCTDNNCLLGNFIESINSQVKLFFETQTLDKLIKGE